MDRDGEDPLRRIGGSSKGPGVWRVLPEGSRVWCRKPEESAKGWVMSDMERYLDVIGNRVLTYL